MISFAFVRFVSFFFFELMWNSVVVLMRCECVRWGEGRHVQFSVQCQHFIRKSNMCDVRLLNCALFRSIFGLKYTWHVCFIVRWSKKTKSFCCSIFILFWVATPFSHDSMLLFIHFFVLVHHVFLIRLYFMNATRLCSGMRLTQKKKHTHSHITSICLTKHTVKRLVELEDRRCFEMNMNRIRNDCACLLSLEEWNQTKKKQSIDELCVDIL